MLKLETVTSSSTFHDVDSVLQVATLQESLQILVFCASSRKEGTNPILLHRYKVARKEGTPFHTRLELFLIILGIKSDEENLRNRAITLKGFN